MELLGKKQGVLIEKIRKVMVDHVSNLDKDSEPKFNSKYKSNYTIEYECIYKYHQEIKNNTNFSHLQYAHFFTAKYDGIRGSGDWQHKCTADTNSCRYGKNQGIITHAYSNRC